MFILDTNVVSELRKPLESSPHPDLIQWANEVDASSLFLSSITLLELELGILLLARKDSRQADTLRHWFENRVLVEFEGRILPVDAIVTRRCAQLHVPNPQSERDAMIAATALVHGMTVVTRNVSDFRASGVALLNPWGN
jgi:toxin FitB